MKRLALALLAVLGLLAVAGVAGFSWLRTDNGKAWLAAEIAERASTPGEMQVAIGRIDGDLVQRIELFDVAVSDADGTWMSVRSIEIEWRPFDLLRGRLILDRAEIRDAALHRLPEGMPNEREPTLDERLEALRSLPAIRVARLGIEDLTLGEPVLGQRAVLRVTGRMDTEKALVRGRFSAQRVDGGAGNLDLKGEYRAASNWLTLDVALAEPSGGLIARALDIPGLPPLRAEAKGSGALADWRGKLAVSFEKAAALNADLSIRHGNATDFGIVGTATIPVGDSSLLRRAVSGGHKFRIDGRYGPDNAVSLSKATWVGPAFDLTATGTLGLEDLALNARLSLQTGATPLQVTPDGITIGAVSAEAAISGRLPAPTLRVTFDAGRLSVPDALTAEAAGTLSFDRDGPEDGRLDGAVTLTSIAWSGRPSLQRLLGGEAALRIAAVVDSSRSEMRVESAQLTASPGELSGSGLFNWSNGDGTAKATLTIPDLAAFRTVVDTPLSGRSTVLLDAVVHDFGASASGTLSGKASGLSLGLAPADAVLAPNAHIEAALSLSDGKFAAERIAVKSGAFEAHLDGTLDQQTHTVSGNYRARIGGGKPIPVAERIALDCICRASGKVQGKLDDLRLNGDIAVRSLRFRDIVLRALTADYDAAKLTGEPSGSLKMKATTPVGAAAAQVKYVLERNRLRLKDLRAEGGTAQLRGTLDLPLSGAPATGTFDIAVASLDAWFAAAGMEGEGNADIQIKMRADGKHQSLDGTARFMDLRFRDGPEAPLITTEQASFDVKTRDFLSGSGSKIDIRIGKGSAGAAKIERILAEIEGSLTQARLSLSLKGDWKGPLAVAATAEYAEKAGRHSLDLATFQGTVIGEKIASHRPLHIDWGDAGLSAEEFAFNLGEAQLTGHIRTSRKDADIELILAHAPLKLIDRFSPFGLDGQAEASLSLKGAWPEPEGKLSFAIPRLRFKGERDAPALKVYLEGDWRSGRLALDGKIDTGRGTPSAVGASIPLRLEGPDWNFSMPRQEPVSASLRWSGETATLWRFVPLSEHLVRGPGKIDLKLVGTLAQPMLEGSVTLEKGYYESLELGTVLRALDLDIAFEGRQARITRLSAHDGGEGKLNGSGKMALDPDAGFPFDFSAKLDKLTAVRRDDVEASASGTLTLSGSAGKVKVQSEITTDQVEIRVLDRLPPEVVKLDVIEVGRGGKLPARKSETPSPPFDVELGIDIAMPRRVFVRGRGIDSEWKGNIKITGTARKPEIAGHLALVRGQMTVVGKTFHLESGSLVLPETGGGEPEILISAVHSARDLTVRAQVEGPVSTPTITLSSTPALPQEEIVSQVLFNKSASSLSVYEAAQLGLALAELTGTGSSGGVLDFVRKTIGVDSLQIESTETAEGSVPVVGAGKYLTEDVYVGVKQGATPESSSIGVEVEVLPYVSVESEVRRSGQSDVGVKFKLDY